MDRKERLAECMKELLPLQFEMSGVAVTQYCSEHAWEVASEVLTGLSTAIEQAVRLQQEKKKGAVKYVIFSCLYSGMFLQRDRIRVDILDERFYGDEAEAAVYLDLNGIYQNFETDIKQLYTQAVKAIFQIQRYEMDYIRFEYMMYYHRMAKAFIKAVLEETEVSFLFADAVYCDEVNVLFGGYMDEADYLLTLRGNADEVLSDIS